VALGEPADTSIAEAESVGPAGPFPLTGPVRCAPQSGEQHCGTRIATRFLGMAKTRIAAVLALLALVAVESARADECAMPVARRALQVCERADHATPAQREVLLTRGLRLAERAVEMDGDDAHAHFAIFCTLGKLAERKPVGIETVKTVRRLRQEVDRTLELAPEYIPALIGKAEMLLRLPRWLGGDPDEAQRCLERARALQAACPVRLARHEVGTSNLD